jgi:hypothetical protein
MTVRCKFKCTSVTKIEAWSDRDKHPFLYSYKMQVVTSGSEENKKFFASTPSGELAVSAVGDDLFQVGKEYFIDITPAE